MSGARQFASSGGSAKNQWILTRVSCVFLIAFSGVSFAAALKPTVTKNCVRLVGGSGSKGRVEVSTKDPSFPGVDGNKGVWLPVCMERFTNETAQEMCELLGFAYGRSYYTTDVAFPSKPRYSNSAAFLSCSPKVRTPAGHRRQLRGGADTAAAGAGAEIVDTNALTTAGVVGEEDIGASRERSLIYALYSTTTPKNAPYECQFVRGLCHSQNSGFAGVECSNQQLPPAPPPPPAPPSPPPYEEMIRVVGGRDFVFGKLESNLCPPDAPEDFCTTTGRVELLVDAPGSGDSQIWAPLCAASEELQERISMVACQQAFGWPLLQTMSGILVYGRPPPPPGPSSLVVPTGQVTGTGDFNPAAYEVWATLSDVQDVNPTMLQAGNLTVSSTPCDNLFAVQCVVLYARRR